MRKTILISIIALAVVGAGLGIAWAAVDDDPAGSGQMTATTDPGSARGPVYIDSVEILLLESYPVQVQALAEGSVPTPCHHLAWDVSHPDAGGRITLNLYSTADPGQVCTQVLEPFEQSIDIGSFTGGSYILMVDGVEYPFTI